MLWDATLLLTYVVAAMGFGAIFCSAPDWLQKLVIGLLATSCLVLVAYYAAQLGRYNPPWQFKLIGYTVQNVAVLLGLFRLYFREKLTCKKSSPDWSEFPG